MCRITLKGLEALQTVRLGLVPDGRGQAVVVTEVAEGSRAEEVRRWGCGVVGISPNLTEFNGSGGGAGVIGGVGGWLCRVRGEGRRWATGWGWTGGTGRG